MLALLWSLEVSDEVLRVHSRHDLYEFPAVEPEVVEDRLSVVHEDRSCQVLPLGYCDFAHRVTLCLALQRESPGSHYAALVTDSVSRQRWQRTRFHIVSGKGGTGKTTAAASLALALASGGKRTLLIEVEGRQGIAQIFDTPPLPYEERKIAIAPGGGEVFALAIDTEAALLEYLEKFYNLKRAGSALRRTGVIDFATTIAPGVRDVLLTGKSIESVNRTSGSRYEYDAVVMDAPPTGRIARFLNATAEVRNIAKVGPIKKHADTVLDLIRSNKTMIHLVTLLEEMPVQETIDGMAEIKELGLPFGAVIVNMVRDSGHSAFGDDPKQLTEMTPTQHKTQVKSIQTGLNAAGLPAKFSNAATATALLDESISYAERVQLEQNERARLEETGCELVNLPYLANGIDLGGLYELATLFKEQVGV